MYISLINVHVQRSRACNRVLCTSFSRSHLLHHSMLSSVQPLHRNPPHRLPPHHTSIIVPRQSSLTKPRLLVPISSLKPSLAKLFLPTRLCPCTRTPTRERPLRPRRNRISPSFTTEPRLTEFLFLRMRSTGATTWESLRGPGAKSITAS